MSAASAGDSDRFAITCPRCDQRITTPRAWVGREVQCPACAATTRVPPPRADGQAPSSMPPQPTHDRMTFNFACPRCSSLLESAPSQSGQTGACPTCGARFMMPSYDPRARRPPVAGLIDGDQQDPTPMHAYAASGAQAPLIRRQPDGTPRIECPRCGYENAVSANNCAVCGVPFSIEGVPTGRPRAGQTLATMAMVLGIVSIPLCVLLVPAGLAVLFGFLSWLRDFGSMPTGRAIAGLVLGTISLALGLWFLMP